jgi:hypothetical protein
MKSKQNQNIFYKSRYIDGKNIKTDFEELFFIKNYVNETVLKHRNNRFW